MNDQVKTEVPNEAHISPSELNDGLASYQLDAERYRWLRDAGATFYTGVDTPAEKKHHVCEWAMDAAIDSAMAANA